jgi:hypothetical protein
MPYAIKWVCSSNGRSGRGPSIESKEVAEQLCRDLDGEFPELKHEVIEVEAEEQANPFLRE